MKKPELLYASPFPPDQSGISDYSAVLVKKLRDKFNITLYTDVHKKEISDKSLWDFPVITAGIEPVNADRFDYCIYNIGNNPYFHKYIYRLAMEHPGLVILHDYIIYYLFVGYYQENDLLYSSMYHNLDMRDFLRIKDLIRKGKVNLLEQSEFAKEMPMNRELLLSGNKIMVHSEYALNNILETGLVKDDCVRHINHIKLISSEKPLISRDELFQKYGVPVDAMVIASFGFIDKRKLNREVCCALRTIKEVFGKNFCYVMVGEGEYADDELEHGFLIKTGFTSLEEFDSFVHYSDIVVNLRNPSMGETSGAMLRILQLGKPCITNNGGWFSELPDDCVYKIDLNDVDANLIQALTELITVPDKRKRIGLRAKEFIDREYSDEKIVSQICSFLSDDSFR